MTLSEIFKKFCNYVDETIFSRENVGSYVAFVIDQSFINDFCTTHFIDEADLMKSVKKSLSKRDILSIKGILAIQLFAASKRANSNGVTEKNYRERLSQVLDWNICDLQSWMKDYQEQTWEILYRWCDSNFFFITKCERKSGAGRYTQYPVNQALRVFTEEDLKYIAACFVDKNLQPGEDIQECDFWKLINSTRISSYIMTNHGCDVVEHSVSADDYLSQIFNFYLIWDGEYKKRNSHKSSKVEQISEYTLYMDNEYRRIDVRTKNLSLVNTISIENITFESLKRYYSFKRSGLILFKKDDVYDSMWRETRYLNEGEDGIVVCLNDKWTHHIGCQTLFKNKKICIYKITDKRISSEFYTQERFYKLEGGLKIGRSTYIRGACPILKLKHTTKMWIDGVLNEDDKLVYIFNYMPSGLHTIKIPNFKKIEFEVVEPTILSTSWNACNNRWRYDRKNNQWESGNFDTGAIGLDFSYISQHDEKISRSILRRWSSFLLNGKIKNKETNIGINLIR